MNKTFYLFLLTTTHIIAKDSSQELPHMQKYCEKHPDSWEGHYNLGRMYYQNSELENAEKCFTESIQHCEQPENQESILYNLGNTYFKEAEKAQEDQQKIPLLEKSIQNYEGAIALNKDAEDTQHNLAIAKKWLEKLKKKQEEQQQKNNNQNEEQQKQQEKKESNGAPNKEQPKGNKQEQQQEQQPQTQQKTKQQEMQNVLQKEQNNERILPVNFSNNSNLPDDKVLKDW